MEQKQVKYSEDYTLLSEELLEYKRLIKRELSFIEGYKFDIEECKNKLEDFDNKQLSHGYYEYYHKKLISLKKALNEMTVKKLQELAK